MSERLRAFEGCGLLLRKWETYDLGFWPGGYEWGTATGGRGIVIHSPKLVVTLKPAATPDATGDLAVKLPTERRGQPTAVMPSAEQIRGFAAQHAFQRPAWMPDWQWQRIQELKALGRVREYPATPDAYGKWMDEMLARPPRTWDAMPRSSWPTKVNSPRCRAAANSRRHSF